MTAGSASSRPPAAQPSSVDAICGAAAHLVELLGLQGAQGPVHVQAAPYVTIHLAAAMTGYSARAIERKIETGVWIEGREWRRAPDGRRLISIPGFARWVESGSR